VATLKEQVNQNRVFYKLVSSTQAPSGFGYRVPEDRPSCRSS
jgi:hypothetical protein